MTTRKWSIVILAVAACFAYMGCRPASQPSVKNQESDPSKIVRHKIDDDSYRMQLLATKLVQKDLHLTPDQTKNLRNLYESYLTQGRKLYAQLTDDYSGSLSEKKSERFCTLLEDLVNARKKLQTKGLAILTPDQTERLKQIQFQTAILKVLECPEILKALSLSEEQLEKIQTRRNQKNQELEARLLDLRNRMSQSQSDNLLDHMPESPPSNLTGFIPSSQKKIMIELQKKSYQDMVETSNFFWDLLTPEQRIELEKRTGKRIDLAQLYNAWMERAESYRNSTNLGNSQENEKILNPF